MLIPKSLEVKCSVSDFLDLAGYVAASSQRGQVEYVADLFTQRLQQVRGQQ